MRPYSWSFLVALTIVAGQVDIPPHARGGRAHLQRGSVEGEGKTSWEGTVQQRCDHFTKASWSRGAAHMSKGMLERRQGKPAETSANGQSCFFSQRFFVDDSNWAAPYGPVMLYLGGHNTLRGTPGGFVTEVARNLSALVVSLEHRFFGESLPEDAFKDKEVLKLLRVEQAIADAASFRGYFQHKHIAAPFGSSRNSWIVVGGGYAAALAAWAKVEHPQLFTAAWASSAPLEPVLDFGEFDAHVAAAVGVDCADALRRAGDAAAHVMLEGNELDSMSLRAEFSAGALGIERGGHAGAGDVLQMIAESVSMAVQYGFKRYLCRAVLHPDEHRGEHPPPPGWGSFGAELVAIANVTVELWGRGFGKACSHDPMCFSGLKDKARGEERDAAAEAYHFCTELASFRSPARNGAGVRGPAQNQAFGASYHMGRCVKAFGKGTRPDVHHLNSARGGRGMPGERVLFTGGADDPWTRVGRNHTGNPLLEEACHPLGMPSVMADCDGCGHCWDLVGRHDGDAEEANVARQVILKHLWSWLGGVEVVS